MINTENRGWGGLANTGPFLITVEIYIKKPLLKIFPKNSRPFKKFSQKNSQKTLNPLPLVLTRLFCPLYFFK